MLDQVSVQVVLLIIIAALFGVAVIALLYERLTRHVEAGSPGQEDAPVVARIEQAIVPYVFRAILSAYRLSEFAMDEFDERMEGADKKAIADEAYALLPDKVAGHDIRAVKSIIPRERFGEIVQDVFDEFDRFFESRRANYARAFSEWKRENEPGS